LTSLGQPKTLTMSSREIAELTGKEHKNVMADIRNMLDKLGMSSAKFSAVYKDQQLIDRPCFELDRELTMTLVTGYDIPMRRRVVTRLAELENAKSAIDPLEVLNDPVAMRGLQQGKIDSTNLARVAK
jgi:phage regulator Rha-like protein